jgi:hypothetical protein
MYILNYKMLTVCWENLLQPGKPRRWEDNIKMDLRKIGSEYRSLTKLAQHHTQWQALILTVLNLWSLHYYQGVNYLITNLN